MFVYFDNKCKQKQSRYTSIKGLNTLGENCNFFYGQFLGQFFYSKAWSHLFFRPYTLGAGLYVWFTHVNKALVKLDNKFEFRQLLRAYPHLKEI